MKINAHCKKEAVGSAVYTREILEIGERGMEEKKQKTKKKKAREAGSPGLMSSQVLKSLADEPKRRLTPGPFQGAAASAAFAAGERPRCPAVGPCRREWASGGGCPEPCGCRRGNSGQKESGWKTRTGTGVTHTRARSSGGAFGPVPPGGGGGAAGSPQPAPKELREPRLL